MNLYLKKFHVQLLDYSILLKARYYEFQLSSICMFTKFGSSFSYYLMASNTAILENILWIHFILKKKIPSILQLQKSLSDKERSAQEFEQKFESERQALISAKAMLEDRISEAQTSKSDWQELKHQVSIYP